jgi:hypothetical protein
VVVVHDPSKHLIGLVVGQIAIGQDVVVGLIHWPLAHFNGFVNGQPKML